MGLLFSTVLLRTVVLSLLLSYLRGMPQMRCLMFLIEIVLPTFFSMFYLFVISCFL
jgi:hypothetical protein